MWFFKQEKKAYISGILFLGVVAILQLVPPKVIGIVVDHIQNQTLTKESLIKWLMILILSGVSMYVLRYYWRIRIFGSSVKLSMILRNQDANLILVLHYGEIYEKGTHQQLLAKKGLYYKMFLLQNGIVDHVENVVR